MKSARKQFEKAELMDAYDVSTFVDKPENDTGGMYPTASGSETLTPQLSFL
jgi:hypothetical protein